MATASPSVWIKQGQQDQRFRKKSIFRSRQVTNMAQKTLARLLTSSAEDTCPLAIASAHQFSTLRMPALLISNQGNPSKKRRAILKSYPLSLIFSESTYTPQSAGIPHGHLPAYGIDASRLLRASIANGVKHKKRVCAQSSRTLRSAHDGKISNGVPRWRQITHRVGTLKYPTNSLRPGPTTTLTHPETPGCAIPLPTATKRFVKVDDKYQPAPPPDLLTGDHGRRKPCVKRRTTPKGLIGNILLGNFGITSPFKHALGRKPNQ